MPAREFESLTDVMCLERPPTTGPGAGVGSLLDDDEPQPSVPATPRSIAAATDVTEDSEIVFLDGALCVEVESMASMCRLVPFVPDEDVRKRCNSVMKELVQRCDPWVEQARDGMHTATASTKLYSLSSRPENLRSDGQVIDLSTDDQLAGSLEAVEMRDDYPQSDDEAEKGWNAFLDQQDHEAVEQMVEDDVAKQTGMSAEPGLDRTRKADEMEGSPPGRPTRRRTDQGDDDEVMPPLMPEDEAEAPTGVGASEGGPSGSDSTTTAAGSDSLSGRRRNLKRAAEMTGAAIGQSGPDLKHCKMLWEQYKASRDSMNSLRGFAPGLRGAQAMRERSERVAREAAEAAAQATRAKAAAAPTAELPVIDHSSIVLPNDEVYRFMPSRGPGGCKFIADESAGMWPIGFQGDANTNWRELRDVVWGRDDIDEWWD